MPFTCQLCGKIVRRSYDLRRHSVLHDPNAQRFLCPYPDCPRSAAGFLQKVNLKTHINARHTKSRAFACRVDGCGRAFWDGSARTRHERNAKQHQHLLGSGHPSSSVVYQTTGRRGNDGECITVGQSMLGPAGQASRLTPEIKQEEMLTNMASNPTNPRPSHINALVSQDLTKLPPMSPTSVSSSFYPAQVGMEASTSGGAPFVQVSDPDLESSASTLSFPPSTPCTSAFFSDPFFNFQGPGMDLNFSNPDPALGYPAIDINAWLASTQEFLGLPDVGSRNGLDSSSGMGPVPRLSPKHDDVSLEGHFSSSSTPFDYDAWYANLL